MITIKFNGELIILKSPLNLNEFLMEHARQNECYAVALNRKFISKSNYVTHLLQEGDHVELITPMQGG